MKTLENLRDLSQCGELVQTLAARPPAIIQGTFLLLVALLASAVGWSAMTRVDLVVQAPGRIRPADAFRKTLQATSGEKVCVEVAGRIRAVVFKEGDTVAKGDVLLRLDPDRVDSEIVRLEVKIESAAREIGKLRAMMRGQEEEKGSAAAKAQSEVEEAEEAILTERQNLELQEGRRRADEGLALQDVEICRRDAARLVGLSEIVPKVHVLRAQEALKQAEGRWERTRIPTPDASVRQAEARVRTARKNRQLVEQQFENRRNELDVRLTAREGEREADRVSLGALKQERERLEVRAPLSGLVTAGAWKEGDVLSSGQSVCTIAPGRGVCVDALVAARDVGLVRVGMNARIKVDAFDYQKYGWIDGKVTFVSPDSDTAEEIGGFGYVTRIELNRDEVGRGEHRGKLRWGMTSQVEILTGEEQLLGLAFRRFKDKTSMR